MLRIVPANPLDHADEIKRLFQAHDRPEFPAFFDRAYPDAVRSGGRSWLGLDPDGGIVMHMARFPHRFALGERSATGGLLVNMMVAHPYRKVFPALDLLRQVVRDSEADGSIDFLYADPNEQAAAILKVGRFRTIGRLHRFVLPVAERSRSFDAVVRLYHAALRLGGSRRLPVVRRHTAAAFDTGLCERPTDAPGRIRPFHPRELYARRLPGYPSATDHWFTFHAAESETEPLAAVLVRGPDSNGFASLCAVHRRQAVPLAALFGGLLTPLRRAGCRRLQLMTLAQSHFAAELRRVGFVPRKDRVPVFATAFTDLGARVIDSVADWEITDLDYDR